MRRSRGLRGSIRGRGGGGHAWSPDGSGAGLVRLRKTALVASSALVEWRSSGLARLAELEAVHAQASGSSRGRRWGTTQLNRSLFVALVAQFQAFCRGLHDEAVQVHVAAAVPGQRLLVRTLLTQGRKLDSQNPRRAALGSDFGRLGFSFIDDLKAVGPPVAARLDALEDLIEFRNAIGHGDEAKITALEASGPIASTKRSYQEYRRALNGLAGTMDSVVASKLAALLDIPMP